MKQKHKYVIIFNDKRGMRVDSWRSWESRTGYSFWGKSYSWQFQYNQLDELYLKFHNLI